MVVALTNPKKKQRVQAIGYIRQSDEREDKEDISEKTQLTKIQQYCDFNDFDLVAVFSDIDYSGFRISYTKRPDLMKAFEYLKNNPSVKKFVSFNLSRITRRKKDFSLIHESLESMGVDICSAAEQLDFSTPTGRLVASILVNFNEYYSDNLSDVTMDNKQTNAEKGRWNGGPAPWGLKKDKETGFFVEDGMKAVHGKQMFQMAKEGNGTFKIAKWTKQNNIKTETGKDWTPRRVRYFLTNPTYAAMQKWGDKYYELLGYAKLLEWTDFLYIQSTLFGKEKAWKGKERQMLTSVLKCPVCGKKMYSRTTRTSTNRRYVCYGKNEPGGCNSPTIDLSTLDRAVIELIANISRGRYTESQIKEKMSEENKGSVITQLRMELDMLEEAKQRLFDDYYINRKITESDFENAMKRFEKRQSEIYQKLEKIPMPNNKFGSFEDILSEMGIAITKLSDDDKRKLVELIISEIHPGEKTKITFRWGETVEIPSVEKKRHKCDTFFY
ncbi:recombinase family protein [Paenibacillus apiarius]|uniref:recombinase family protein n=1 Tax=Paenibacillus apiarius TaxID=46240 RepID=UPI003B3B598B